MNLPIGFVRTVESTFGEQGRRFIADLPALIAEASTRWDLSDVRPVSELSYNFVASANRKVDAVVLKIGVPRAELTSEMAALRLFNGEGACRLIAHDEGRGFLLLERLQPGVMLSTLEDDEEATRIAADVMHRIWRPAAALPAGDSYDKFIRLSDWFDGWQRLRSMFDGETGPLEGRLVARAEGLAADLLTENHQPVLIHGDFHHFNVLSSERGWLVIDPKGVIGPAGYEVGPFLMNPWPRLPHADELQRLTRRRIDILHERLGFERERVRAWGLAHAVLSAWWGIEDGTGWEYSARFAEVIADMN